MLSAARRGRLCMEETNATPGGISLRVMLVPTAHAIAPPAPTHGGRTPHWWFRRKGRVCGVYLRTSAWQGMPKRATHRGEGPGEQTERTEGTEGSRRCTVRPDMARSRREDAESTVGTDGDRRRVLPPDMERVTEGRGSSPVPRSRPSEQAPPRSLRGKNR